MKKIEIDLEITNITAEHWSYLPARNKMHKDEGEIVNFNYSEYACFDIDLVLTF